MTDFTARYNALNAAQKEAVDTIEGPVMVVAGPGTGKTELLGVRVANILKKTDELPNNILCLTFTESGAAAMRERLVGLIGPDAYKVAIHTFHSFGAEIINQYGEYFYNGAHFRPADELSTFQVLRGIFEQLPHTSPIASKMNDEYTYLRDAQGAISDLKKSGLTPDELLSVLERNEAFIAWVQPHLQATLGDRLSKKSFDAVRSLIETIQGYSEEPLSLINYEPLSELMAANLDRALAHSEDQNSTKPLSAWKRGWCEKRETGDLTLKDEKRCQKVRAVAAVYYEYLVAMQSRELYDFDDMILRVVHGIEVFHDLRFNLQEQYHYIMVDEFQDTNDAQMRLVWNLTNAPVSEGRPNLLVVGDDDQAIYRFQGANISNILGFRTLYRDVQLITLKDNYRSSGPILEASRRVIIQGQERLETSLPELDKTLTPHRAPSGMSVELTSYETDMHEYSALAQRLKNRDQDKTHAVISRNHRQLRALLPYLHAEGLPLKYQAQENILENPAVMQLELVARITHLLSVGLHSEANALIPQLVSHPAWHISAKQLWELSLKASKEGMGWLEIMSESTDELARIAGWLIECAKDAQHQPLEYMLDLLFGTVDQQLAENETSEPFDEESLLIEGFTSPYRAYYFDDSKLESAPVMYMQFLSALRTLRSSLREYVPQEILYLRDFISFLDLHHALKLPIQGTNNYGAEDTAIELLTAHRSKGLEFDDVTVISLTDDVWGETARTRGRLIRFPHNLPLDAAGDTTDERLRLLFVAMTRAKECLHLTTHEGNATGKATPLVAYVIDEQLPLVKAASPAPEEQLKAETIDWRAPLLQVDQGDQRSMLQPLLDRYKLSATHFNNFLDVTRGGPNAFLLHNLLRLPQAMSPSAAYGSAVHAALQKAHQHLRATDHRRPLEDVLGDFETELRRGHMSALDFEHFLTRGSDLLTTFLNQRYDSFSPSQVTERNFASEGVKLGDATITGAIDLIEINESAKTIVVTDYKTGRASSSWQGKTEYEKIKLHHYKQQLMFYKLLIENSRQYRGYTVTKGVIEFVEPNTAGKITCLELNYTQEELDVMTQLIQEVWRCIMELDFQIDAVGAAYRDILNFESSLIS